MATAPFTSDGHLWTPEKGIEKGALRSIGVIEPSTCINNDAEYTYDVIVIGAGYAGLMAARELSEAKVPTLLLEARDRIGGRTWTAEVDGYLYEMGGTWVTHWMGYLQKEMERYNMANDLILSKTESDDSGYFTLEIASGRKNMPLEEAGKMQARAWDLFVNVDGHSCRTVCPLPHSQLNNVRVARENIERLDQISCRERYDEIKGELNESEQALLQSLLLHISGGTLENSSLWDMVRSHALMGHSSDNFEEVWLMYKLREGQSMLARKMFDEAVDSGLDYAFTTPISSISDNGSIVTVQSADGTCYRARRVITTIPLNVLHAIRFEPALSQRRQEAIQLGHVNQMSKVHAEVTQKMPNWRGCTYPGKLLYAYGDGLLPNGNTHVVAFGADERETFCPEEDPEKVLAALGRFREMDVQKLVFHNWNTDAYAQAGPAWWRPGYITNYQEELQSRHGNVFFASADWAHGWRAAIDGALEQGFLNALEARRELRALDKKKVNGFARRVNGLVV